VPRHIGGGGADFVAGYCLIIDMTAEDIPAAQSAFSHAREELRHLLLIRSELITRE
jgi:hypothetical protein